MTRRKRRSRSTASDKGKTKEEKEKDEKEDKSADEQEKEEKEEKEEKDKEKGNEENDQGEVDAQSEEKRETKAERKKRKQQERRKRLIDAAVDFNTKLLQERYKRGPTYWDPHTRTSLYYEKWEVCLVPDIVNQDAPPTTATDGQEGDVVKGRDSPLPVFEMDPLLLAANGNLDKLRKLDKKRRRAKAIALRCDTCGVEDKEGNLLTCLECGDRYHIECLELKPENVEKMNYYGWKCMHCKTCEICKDSGNEEKLLFCDACDRGFHTFCLNPPLLRNPTGTWYCSACVECKSCGSKSPGVGVSCRWRAEYTMCEACYQLLTENKYCPKCRKVYRQSDKLPMMQCTRCRWKYHVSCDEEGAKEDPYLCYRCKSGDPPDVKPEDKKRNRSRSRKKGQSTKEDKKEGDIGNIPTLIITPPVNDKDKGKEEKGTKRKRKKEEPASTKEKGAKKNRKSPTKRTKSDKKKRKTGD